MNVTTCGPQRPSIVWRLSIGFAPAGRKARWTLSSGYSELSVVTASAQRYSDRCFCPVTPEPAMISGKGGSKVTGSLGHGAGSY